MPQRVPLESIPNQSLSIRLEGRRYEIRLNWGAEIMSATIIRDDEFIISGVRCVPGSFLLPYQYLEESSGNFVFETSNGNLPNYQDFGDTQILLYFSNEELEVLRNGT